MKISLAFVLESNLTDEAAYSQGNSCFNQGHFIEAAAKYTEAAKTWGLKPTFLANLASTYIHLEQ